MDLDVDSDMDVDGSGGSWFMQALHFFNFGKLPFMVIMSLIILSQWTISILANYYWGKGSLIFAAALFFPSLFISLCLTKVVSSPLVPFFESMTAQEKEVDFIGLLCTIIVPATTTKMGQAEVTINGNPLLINIKLEEGVMNLKKGAEALITSKDKLKNCFFIKPEKS